MAVVAIDPRAAIGVINPNLYGHFAEHLGACIYDGLWVGEDSPIPNTGGFRNDVIRALRAMRAPILRWPGGCFADDYHWQDGIGPRAARPARINLHWGAGVETNAVGTQEFVRLCRLVGAEPYFCGNLGSGSVGELRDWVEYCNYPGDSALARQRAVDGSPAPLSVRYWGIGNESWGCGGGFAPDDYAAEYRRYATFVRGFGGPMFLVACGPNGNDADWTRRFFDKFRRDYGGPNNLHGFAAHYYCGTAGTATAYSTDEWYQLIASGLKMETLVVEQRALMDAYDPARRVGLIVDEWGTWHPPEPGANPAFLYQQNTLRDALVAATTLDIFNRHADKVVMANIAQTVNVLQAVVLTRADQMLVTPTGHVYALYAPHQGGQAVQTRIESERVSYQMGDEAHSLPAVAASASLKGKTLFVTVTNCHASQGALITLELAGVTARAASARLLTGAIHAHNTFDQPEAVTPAPCDVHTTGAAVRLECPAAAVAAISIELA